MGSVFIKTITVFFSNDLVFIYYQNCPCFFYFIF